MEGDRVMTVILKQLRAGYGCEMALYRHVRELARRQAQLLHRGAQANGLALLRLSAEKERLLENIGAIDGSLAPSRAVLAREKDFIMDGALDGLNEVLDDLYEVIEEIRGLELESYSLVAPRNKAERRPAVSIAAAASLN